MYAKKSLGQHFLKSERALSLIVETGNVKSKDTVLEIGPGTGTLTSRLLEAGAKVVAVEKDDRLFELMEQKFAAEIKARKFILIHDDILELDLSKWENKKYKLIANIPYNITGAILKKFLSAKSQPGLMVLLLQKEVAKRIVAQDKKESILSISVKAYGSPKYIETVKAGSFAPMPLVDSAIIIIESISKDFFTGFSEKNFFEMVRVAFKSKRKKLSSNLSVIFEKKIVIETFRRLNLDENLRAEDVRMDLWHKLANILLAEHL